MTNTNEKEAIKMAYKMICSTQSIACKKYSQLFFFRKSLDFRFNQDRLIYSKIVILSKSLDFSEIAKKQKQRVQNRHIKHVENYMNNKLVIDYFKNKSSIKYISDNCIYFYCRNHWAKNNTDLKIISVLRKHFINYKKVKK